MEIIILCEDYQQSVFAKKYFESCGIKLRKIRIRPIPKGKGSGEQYVKNEYPKEVRTFRSKSYMTSIRLAVIIDADNKTVNQRKMELDKALEEDGQSIRQEKENIAIFVPKRNIETWIHYLMDEKVDEESDYRKLKKNQSYCKDYVEKLAKEICPVGLPDDAPSSLKLACKEMEKIY